MSFLDNARSAVASKSADFAAIEAQFNNHPAVQAFLRNPRKSALGWVRVIAQVAKDTGVQLPHDYQPAIRGGTVTLEKKSFIERNGWFLPAVAIGAPLAAGAALGAFSAPAAAASGGGGVGLGETGAVTGLGGSGFGTGGGLGYAGAGGGIAGGMKKAVEVVKNKAHTTDSFIDALKKALIPTGLAGLASLTAPKQPQLPPELTDMLALQKQRMLAQQPLQDSVLRLAQSRLPASAQGPGGGDPMQQALAILAKQGVR